MNINNRIPSIVIKCVENISLIRDIDWMTEMYFSRPRSIF